MPLSHDTTAIKLFYEVGVSVATLTQFSARDSSGGRGRRGEDVVVDDDGASTNPQHERKFSRANEEAPTSMSVFEGLH